MKKELSKSFKYLGLVKLAFKVCKSHHKWFNNEANLSPFLKKLN